LVEGALTKPADKLIHWLSHEHHRAEVCREGDKGAQRAVLSYATVKTVDGLTLLQVDLETGRYHQIRAQLADIGCPIAGDEKYGAKQKSKDGSIALHHRQLEVVHPTKKEPVTINAPYPANSGWWGLLD
jgi:23S rRNA pseudouridine1911/1915/1917 synthase